MTASSSLSTDIEAFNTPYLPNFPADGSLTDNMLGSRRLRRRALAPQAWLAIPAERRCHVWTQVKPSSHELASQAAATSGHSGVDAH